MNEQRQEEIRIFQEVAELQARQNELLERLATLRISSKEQNKEHAPPQSNEQVLEATELAARKLDVGMRVRVRNPKKDQPTRGVITHIGSRFITVKGPGTKSCFVPILYGEIEWKYYITAMISPFLVFFTPRILLFKTN